MHLAPARLQAGYLCLEGAAECTHKERRSPDSPPPPSKLLGGHPGANGGAGETGEGAVRRRLATRTPHSACEPKLLLSQGAQLAPQTFYPPIGGGAGA